MSPGRQLDVMCDIFRTMLPCSIEKLEPETCREIHKIHERARQISMFPIQNIMKHAMPLRILHSFLQKIHCFLQKAQVFFS